jgi:hypothetical protein
MRRITVLKSGQLCLPQSTIRNLADHVDDNDGNDGAHDIVMR